MINKILFFITIAISIVTFTYSNNLFAEKTLSIPPAPKLDVKAYILQDYYTGEILAEYNAHKQIEPASLTKMMVSYIVSKEIDEGRIDPTSKVTVSNKARNAQGSRMFLEHNTQVPIQNLLKGIIIQSGNDASIAIAEYISGDEDTFVSIMNLEAQRLQMNNTHFTNVTGLPATQHYTTAYDLAILARAIINDYPEDYELYKQKEFSHNKIKQLNRNQLLWHPTLNVDGLKTGHTDSAGYCLAASAKNQETRLIAIIVGAKSEKDRASNTQTLLSYGFRFFKTYKLYSKEQEIAHNTVKFSNGSEAALGLQNDINLTLPKGEYKNLSASAYINNNLTAPIKKDQVLGELIINLNDKLIGKYPLVALNYVPQGSMWQRLKEYTGILIHQSFNKANNDNNQQKVSQLTL